MTDHERNDCGIEDVLEALRLAEPPAGLESRVLRRLETTAPRPAGRRWSFPLAGMRLGATAGWAAGVAAVLVTAYAVQAHHAPAGASGHLAGASGPALASSGPAVAAHGPGAPIARPDLRAARQSPTDGLARTAGPAARSAGPAGTPAGHGPEPGAKTGYGAKTAYGAAPAAGSQPSYGYPAPPMPLTAEERLLLRAARGPAGEQTLGKEAVLMLPDRWPDRLPSVPTGTRAGLNRLAERQVEEDRQEHADFDIFFPPPTPLPPDIEEQSLAPSTSLAARSPSSPVEPNPTPQPTPGR